MPDDDQPRTEDENPGPPLRRHASFLKLWAGQSVSLAGSAVTGLALPLTAIYALHAGAFQIGLLEAALWLPYVVLGLWAGAWTDRHRRRPVMIWADTLRALIMGLVVILAVTHVLDMTVLYIAIFVFGTMTMLFDVCYNSYVPAIVTRKLLVDANSRLQASASVAQVAGPGVGGVLVQLVTAPVALVADAASFVVSAVSLLWIRDTEPVPPPARPGEGMIRQVQEGLRVVTRQPLLRTLMGTAALFNLFAQWMVALLVLFAVRDLGLKAGVIGLISGLAAVGALAGSLLAGRASQRLGIGPAIVLAVVLECLVMLGVPFAPAHHPVLATALLSLLFAINGVGTAMSSIAATSIRQAITPPELIGRMTATYKFVTYGVVSLGALCGGLSGQWLGLRHGMLIGAVALLSTVVWTIFSPLRRLRELPAMLAAAPAGPAREAAAVGLPVPSLDPSAEPVMTQE